LPTAISPERKKTIQKLPKRAAKGVSIKVRDLSKLTKKYADYLAKKADEEIRTLDPLLGKEMLYH
jgi:hypothetical protein